MYPHMHLIVGFLFGVIGLKLGIIQPNDIIIIVILSVLIDFDLYLSYLFHYKDANLRRFLNFAVSKADNHKTIIHNLSGIALMVPLIFVIAWFDLRLGYILIVSYLPHMILDHIDLVNKRLVEYKVTEVFGVKFPWNFAQEIIFLILVLLAMLILFYG
jgi:hypothetical protein